MDTTGKLVWFVAGAAIGASIALLYAPQSGKDTRRYISRQTRKSREAIADTASDLYEKGKKVADQAADLFDRGRQLVQG